MSKATSAGQPRWRQVLRCLPGLPANDLLRDASYRRQKIGPIVGFALAAPGVFAA